MPIDIQVGSGSLGANWQLLLRERVQSPVDGVVRIDQVLVQVGNDEPLSLMLAQPAEIPRELIEAVGTAAPGLHVFKLLTNAATSLIALRDDTLRRLAHLEAKVDRPNLLFLGVHAPFGSAAGVLGAEVKLTLGGVWTNGPNDPLVGVDVLAEFSVFADANWTTAGVTARRRVGWSCVVRGKGQPPSLRLTLPDWSLALPDFDLPSFRFETNSHWQLSTTAFNCASRLLRRLSSHVAVGVSGLQTAKLALRLNGSALDWAIVNGDVLPTDWDDAAQLHAKLASADFSISIGGGGALSAGVTGVTLQQVNGVFTVSGTPNAQLAVSIPIDPAGSKTLGPLVIRWRGIDAVISGASTTGQLVARIDFECLSLELADDPGVVISFSGAVLLTASGAEVLALKLVAPFPIALVVAAANALVQGAGSVARVVVDFATLAGGQIESLLLVLARIAAAIGKATVFVTTDAADMLGRALVAIADALADALNSLATLAQTAGSVFALELRVGTDPIELRQVLLTLRHGTPAQQSHLHAAGFDFRIAGGWRSGVLWDLVDEPGAYLVASREGNEAAIAEVSTDLWLERPAGGVAAARDAAGVGANVGADVGADVQDRAGERLVRLVVSESDAAPQKNFLVLAGLCGGTPVFLQRFEGAMHDVTLPNGARMKVLDGPYVMRPLASADVKVEVRFQPDRVLPLLGMGEPAPAATAPPAGHAPAFLDRLRQSFGNVVWVKNSLPATVQNRMLTAGLVLGVKAAGLETEATLKLSLSLDTFQAGFDVGTGAVSMRSRRIEERALGLLWVVEQANAAERAANAEIEMFRLGFAGAQSGMELNLAAPGATEADQKGKARMALHFDALSADGKGIVFEVERLKVGPGGLDLSAGVRDEPVRLNGLDAPFRFTSGRLDIEAGKLVHAMAEGRGALPPALVGDAACTIALAFGAESDGGIVLQSGKVRIEKVGEPIVCHATRFTLTITDLDIGIVRDNGYHFYFLVTGSLRFTPKAGEFERGLLQYLDGVEMLLERTPLAADPSVLARHISFQKTLNPKKSFNLFNLFTFELRGFGYHPASPKFDGDPAINISGQVRFIEIGDVMQPSIDFHGLWMALPAKGESLPRIRADGLGVDLNLKGAIRVKGTVLAVDRDTRTVEGAEYAPAGYDMSGFLGSGELTIPGFGDLAANLGFVELAPQNGSGERKKAFFFYAEKRRVAVEIVTPIWVFYLREFGFGFGFRYTLEALKAADAAGDSIPRLISALDDVSKRQGDLHRIGSWRADPDGDKVTLALKGALQAYPADKVYSERVEATAENPFFFDLVAAIRSDFTLFMGVRGWLGTNYHDYEQNTENLRSNPGLRGYLYVSAPRKQLLMRAIGASTGYIGERIEALAKGPGGQETLLRRALRSVDWSATLFIKPGLFHFEMGWPNQLSVRLVDEPKMRVNVRGGMIFRAAEDGLLWAYNIEADAFFSFGGELQLGPVELSAQAVLQARFVARVLAFLSSRVQGSMVYGLISLDATLSVDISAKLKVDLGFTSFKIPTAFSISLLVAVAAEAVISTDGFGARVDARVAVCVFGRTLSVGIGFTLNEGRLVEARSRVQRFLAMSITAEAPDAPPAIAAPAGDATLTSQARRAISVERNPPLTDTEVKNPTTAKVDRTHAWLGQEPTGTDFWLVLRKAGRKPGGDALESGTEWAYAMLVPKEPAKRPNGTYSSSFYAAPCVYDGQTDARSESAVCYELSFANVWPQRITRWPKAGQFDPFTELTSTQITMRWNAQVKNDADENRFTLAHLFDECFLYDATWEPANQPNWRKTTAWNEPPPRIHRQATPIPGETVDQRAEARDNAQRDHRSKAEGAVIVDAVHQARSTVLSSFFEQFKALARSGVCSAPSYAHVTDTGLVFFGPVDELEKLADAIITIQAANAGLQPGRITPLNRWHNRFERIDPVLAPPPARQRLHGQGLVEPDGIKLAWELALPFTPRGPDAIDPEQLLECYEVLRAVEGFAPQLAPKTVKRTATLGASSGAEVTLHASDWQFVDDLSDLPSDMRRALLPPSDDAGAMAAAVEWASQFGDAGEITVTYSVAPRDIAGTLGEPKGFVVVVPRPQPPLRAAEAELRFIVASLESDTSVADGTAPVDTLAAVMIMRDASFLSKGEQSRQVSGMELRITREYRLIADPEDIRPSGHYGAGGLTDRGARAPIGFVPSADQKFWSLPTYGTAGFVDLENAEPDIQASAARLEPDTDARKKFRYWRALGGHRQFGGALGKLAPRCDAEPGADFLSTLWRRDRTPGAPRIATRFWLITVQRILRQDGTQIAETQSAPTPVPVELRVEPKPGGERGLSRPEAFEWPIVFAPPPLAQGQVRVRSGFAAFRSPTPGSGFQCLTAPVYRSTLVRDPQRRVLTELWFDALPQDWVGLHASHASTLSGYDVHQLDLDDLARADAAAGVDATRLDWAAARRVARVERITREEARLEPVDNKDWQGWQAHYPSETWRLSKRIASGPGASPPRRAPWYSAAESTLCFAARNPRLRFFTTVPEEAVQNLMQLGIPSQLKVSLRAAAGSPGALTLAPWGAAEQDPLSAWRSIITPDAEGEWDAAGIRLALLRLGWHRPADDTGSTRWDDICARFRADPASLDGLSVRIESSVRRQKLQKGDDGTGSLVETEADGGVYEAPLALVSFVHPLLDEVLGELQYHAEAGRLYQRYVVTTASVQPIEAPSIDGFFAATPTERDPHGWAALQQLGLAVTVSLYDRDEACFLDAKRLARCVDAAMRPAVQRYLEAYATPTRPSPIGQPFVDVLLKPTRDRISAPFDGVTAGPGAATAEGDLDLAEDGLAIMQLALRPAPGSGGCVTFGCA